MRLSIGEREKITLGVRMRGDSVITAAQSRAARALLDWHQAELARRSNLSESTIRNFEKGRALPSINNLAAVRRSFEDAGVIVIDENGEGPGVRLRKVEPPSV